MIVSMRLIHLTKSYRQQNEHKNNLTQTTNCDKEDK